MLGKEDIRYVREKIAPHVAPILSLYVDVNPAIPENANRAWLVRAKNAVRELSVPKDIAEKVITQLEVERPTARTYVVFAAEDLLQLYHLQVDLPLTDTRNGRVLARWGEPYVYPLLYVFDEYERFGVVFIDQERWRFFEVFLGEIREVEDVFAKLPREEAQQLVIDRPAQRYMGGVPLRGGAARDRFARHVEVWVQRFYKQVAHLLQHSVDALHIDRLILMGPHEDTRFFEQYLPRALRSRVAFHVSSLPRPGATPGEVMKKIEPVLEDARQRQELELINQVREKGIWGLAPVLEALQVGRLYLLIAPWNLGGHVWRCPNGWVTSNEQEAQRLCPGEPVAKVELPDIIVDLASAYGTRLEFVKDGAEQQLIRELGGIAGLPRW